MDTSTELFQSNMNVLNMESTLIRVACLGVAADTKQNILSALNYIQIASEQVHKLIPVIIANLPDSWFSELSESPARFLQLKRSSDLAMQLAHRAQIEEVAALSAKHNFPLILLKSSALNANLYTVDAPRGCNDLDILANPNDWKRAQSVFSNTFTYTEKEQADVFGDLYEESYKPKGPVGYPIDLHKSLCHPYLFDVDYQHLWSTSSEHPFYNNSLIRTLSPEYQLIHLAIHGFSDMSFKTYALCDAYRLLTSPLFNKHTFTHLVKSSAVKVPTYHLLSNLFTVLPEIADTTLLKKIKPNALQLRISYWLLKKRNKLENGFKQKDFQFRLHQVFCMHVFTGEFFKPLALQLLFIRMNLSQMLNKNTKMRAAK
ncbi:nucleotidyltransferase family protein [Alteromonas sp. BMJM2]|uniref:nucleotidyltransferase family protein n=1 Tax=Alteromonas sp. BMJM2 TaxID=2954241 RepID=UPI0022B37A58|nr:nucleotidyltransferase family protein [Alteromonas sp. BMJM2]